MAEEAEVPVQRTQTINDLGDYGPGTCLLSFYGKYPNRIEFNEESDPGGLYRTVSVSYTASDVNPFTIRTLSKYGIVDICNYKYVQYEGFKSIDIGAVWLEDAPELTIKALPAIASYFHDLLLFHSIEPPSCDLTLKEDK
jgi:hypothetical protein